MSESNSESNFELNPESNPAPATSIADIHRDFPNLEPGTQTNQTRTIAGRLMLRRAQGKLAFGTLQDSTGRLQIFAPAATTPDFADFCECSIGDWLEVTGEIMTTRRGELSIRADSWQPLARTRQPFPDKWHGLADPDTRYRQRYLDLWVTEKARHTFLLRSRLLSQTRSWLEARGYIEVETPILHPIAGGALATPFKTHHQALDIELYLRIAPELYLKRLIVGGLERVFEIGRVFRNEGLSTRHNPEFTLLELYSAYGDYRTVLELTRELIMHLAQTLLGTLTLEYDGRELSLEPPQRKDGDRTEDESSAPNTPWREVTMRQLLLEQLGAELDLTTPPDQLRSLCRQHEVPLQDWWGPGKLITELYEKTCEPNLWQPTFVTEYPLEVSPLALESRANPGWTERFELIIAGREIANAFSELTDPDIQRQRFAAQADHRRHGDLEAMPPDEDYLKALTYGMPPTGGLGIGIDRLVGLLSDQQSIRDVLLFPTLRPASED